LDIAEREWGTEYRACNDVVRLSMAVNTLEDPVEQFMIRVDSAASGRHCVARQAGLTGRVEC
jgi:hypothetical protein